VAQDTPTSTDLSSSLLCKSLLVGVDTDVKFAEPWEAKVFAIIVGLAQEGHFTWSEWVECFSKEVAAEKLFISKGVTTREQLLARRFAVASVGSTHMMK